MTVEKVMLLNVINSKKYWYWYLQYFPKAVLVSAILFAKVLVWYWQ